MWEGLDRFLKTVELNGLMAVDFKEFQHSTMLRHERQDEEMSGKMTTAEFYLKIKETKDELNERIRSNVQTLEERLDRTEQRTEKNYSVLMEKIEEVEL